MMDLLAQKLILLLIVLCAFNTYAAKTYRVDVEAPYTGEIYSDANEVRRYFVQQYTWNVINNSDTIIATFSNGITRGYIVKNKLSSDALAPITGAQGETCDNKDKNVVGPIVFSYSNHFDNLANAESDCGPDGSPLLIDLGNNGFHFSSTNTGVTFDLFNSSHFSAFQWIAAGSDDVFLAIDENSNGIIDDGSELFGEGTELLNSGKTAKDGFKALKQYDQKKFGGNTDGVISGKDRIWGSLLLWNDVNSDGITQEGELSQPGEYGIKEFKLKFKKRDVVIEGNRLLYWSKAIKESGEQIDVVDVFFKRIY